MISGLYFFPKNSTTYITSLYTFKSISAFDMSSILSVLIIYLLWALTTNTFFHHVWSTLLLLLYYLTHHSSSYTLTGIVSLLCLVLSPANLLLFRTKPNNRCDPLEIYTNGSGNAEAIYCEFVLSFLDLVIAKLSLPYDF